jgi:hypothetical protein
MPQSREGLLFVLALVTCVLGIWGRVGAAEGAQDGVLRLLYWQAPTVVNPHLSIGTKDLSASRIVYEPLASFDKDGRLIPFLAAEIPSLWRTAVSRRMAAQ